MPTPIPLPVVDPSTVQADRRYPSISLLVPLAGDSPWPLRLRALRREAEQRLRAEFGDDVDTELLSRLEEAVDGAAAPSEQIGFGPQGLAVYVDRDRSYTVPVGFAVRERVVIDDTFATRDLVHDENRRARYWVLALDLDRPRLLRGRGGELQPVPLPVPDGDGPRRTGRGRFGRDRSDVDLARRTRRLRAIDAAVAPLLRDDMDPIVVVGPEPSLSRFLAVTRHIGRIERPVRRAPESDLAALARSVAPAVADVLADRRAVAFHILDRAVGVGRAASGIGAVWRSARRERGALLLVEETFEYPAWIRVDGTLEPSEDAAAAGVVDDAVDDVIEHVLGRGGRVEIVPDGTLDPHGRIALVADRRR